MFRKMLGLCAAALALSAVASASDANGKVYVIGPPGIAPCSEAIAKIQAKDEAYIYDLQIWIGGYLTGAARALPDTYNLMGNTTADALMKTFIDFCTKNPTQQVEAGVFTVVEGLYEGRQKTETP